MSDCALNESKAIMEADTAIYFVSDIPLIMSCLFRDKQILKHKVLCKQLILSHPSAGQECWLHAEWHKSFKVWATYCNYLGKWIWNNISALRDSVQDISLHARGLTLNVHTTETQQVWFDYQQSISCLAAYPFLDLQLSLILKYIQTWFLNCFFTYYLKHFHRYTYPSL